ncbi:MAG: dienelactone hydrolase family protein [Hyphomicrobiales bacterium]|nr:dienelactone hydrolase family protein [Hyphomicrobiales bacterium]
MNTIPSLHGPSRGTASGNPAKQLCLFLHGLGADGQDLLGLAELLMPHFPDMAFTSPNAPFPCDMAPFGYQWFSLQNTAPDALLAGVQHASPILNHYIDVLLEEYSLSISDLVVIGFSQGTMTALHTLLRREAPCAAVVGYSGALIAPSQLRDDLRCRPPVCLVHGNVDMVVPYEALAQAERTLAENGVSVETHTRPGLGHGIDPEGVEIAVRFLKKQL